MQPLRLILPGAYWDSQIYAGRLYLFGLEGDITTLDWDAAIAQWPIARHLRLALIAGFLRSDFLYGAELFALFQDPEIREILQGKFHAMADKPLVMTSEQLSRCTIGRQDNPFPFPHADTEIYDRVLYVGGSSGLHHASCARRTRFPVSTRISKKLDVPVLGLAASYGTIAVASGSDGLFEVPTFDAHWRIGPEPRPTTEMPCEDCNWAFQSIFASSSTGAGFLVEYSRYSDERYEQPGRFFEGVRPATGIFGHEGYAWGVQDKLCLAYNGSIEVVRYLPWLQNRGTSEVLRAIGQVEVERHSSQIIAASMAPYGVVIEYEDSLVVYPSQGPPVVLAGEPVNWRVFPRAKHYENQLHIVYADRLEILSFNHDYLVDQEEKLLGTTVMQQHTRAAAPLLTLMLRE
jgi:hypothetical protein